MELTEIILILGVLGMVSGVVITVLFRVIPSKKARNAGDASVGSMYSVFNQQVTDVLKLKDNQIKSLQGKIRQYEDSGDEEEEESIPPELLEPIAKKFNIAPQQLSLLLDNPQVKKMLGGKNAAQTITALAPLLSGLGGGNNNQSQQPNNYQNLM